MTKVCFVFFALLVATIAMADNELKLKALSEAETPRISKATATDVSINPNATSFLTLDDPTPKIKTRSYDWVLGVKIQSFQPSGEIQGYRTAPLRLENMAPFYLPSLEAGLRFQTFNDQWHWGTLLHAGYSSQAALVSFADKTQDPESRLTTILSDAGFMLEFEPALSSWGLQSSLGAGVLNYSQSGASAYTNVTKTSTFQFLSAGAHLNVGTQWQVLVSYMNRNLLTTDTSGIFLPTDSAELGTRFLW